MASKERENFNKNSTLIVEHTKNGFTDLTDLNVTLTGYSSFEDFINAKQHDIYHLCYNRSRCCQCLPGYTFPSARVLYPSQLETLLNKNGFKKTCHNPGRTADFCCCVAHLGLTTGVLDVTLARCLLLNFGQDVFWYSCLTAKKRTLEDFLTHNKHDIYHLYDNIRCCQCPSSYVVPTQRHAITTSEWNQLFSTSYPPCANDTSRVVSGIKTICSSSVTSGITVAQLGADLSQMLIEHYCPLRKSVQKLAHLRNSVFGHVKEAKISDNNYVKYRNEIEPNLLLIAKVCNKESVVQQQLIDLDNRTLDGTLLMQTIKEQLYTVEVLSTQMEQESAKIITKITQHFDKQLKDMSTTFGSQLAEDIVKQQTEEKQKKLLENTENSIKTHANENTFVCINAVKTALTCVIQNGIVVLIGSPGIGKSRIGLELLRQISAGDKRHRSIQLDDISQWQDMSDGMDAILIDDVFGRTNCSYNDNVHSRLLETIFTTIKNKNVTVILTLRNEIYRTIANINARHRIFHGQHVFNLSSGKNQMTENEKKSCLMNYLTKNKILVTDDLSKENINDDYILDTASTVYLHEDTLKTILQADIGSMIGFPEACYLFASHRKFTKRGHNFFCHPTEHLSNEIDILRMDGDMNKRSMIEFTLFVYILLNDDSVNIDEMDFGAFRTIMETMYLNALVTVPISYINDSAKRLSGKYLKINNDGNYCFQHRLISEAVMISYSITDPRSVIPLLGFDFITEMTRPKCYQPRDGEVIFPVPEPCYSLLAQRLLQLLDKDFKRKPYLFVRNLCKSNIITMTGNNILQEMITQYKYIPSRHFDLEFIRDHRFSGTYSHVVGTRYFYLPSVLMMFCTIDNNSICQCLFNSIQNTLTSESDSSVKGACEDSLMETLNFAICTMDIKRATVLLKILKDSNVKRGIIQWGFCSKIIECHGLSGVQFTLDLHDLSYVCNITSLLSGFFEVFIYDKINIDDNMKQFITSVCEHYNHDRLFMRNIGKFVCQQGQLDFVKDVCEKFDSSLLDIDGMIIEACKASNTEVIQWLTDKYCDLYDEQTVLEQACWNGNTESVQILLDHSNFTLLDMKSAMNWACRRRYNTKLVKWLFQKFDNNLFDMKSAMNEACGSGSKELVKWLLEKFDNDLFDMKSAMNKACSSGDTNIVKWLCEKFDNKLFDLKTALNEACYSCNTTHVKCLREMFDSNLFDLKTVMNEACRSDDTELVKWLCENFDNNLFDLRSEMNEACFRGNTKLVKWWCENLDNNLFDLKTAVKKAGYRRNTELVKWLCKKFGNDLFDVKSAMNEACSSGSTELVKWLLEKFDNDLFDMKSAMNNACSSRYNTAFVKWLCGKFHNDLFILKSAMNEACSSGDTELVKWLCEKFDNSLFDLKTAMNKAFSSSKTAVVKWLLEKFDNDLFDIKSLMNNACSKCYTELAKLLLEKCDNDLFDITSMMNNACSSGDTELVKWLCEKFDNNLFDLKTVMNETCYSRNTELVKWLREKFDHYVFDLKAVMNEACYSRNTELVKWFHETFDNNVFDLKTVMNEACRSCDTELVKWLCETFDNNLFDMKSAMNEACYRGNTKIVKWLCEKFDNNLFALDTALKKALHRRNTELVKWLCEKFRNNLFDMKSTMNEACSSGDNEIVKWLLEKFNNDLFDMNSAMIEACGSGSTELVNWLLEKFDNDLFDMKSAMNNACSSGDTELVKWLFEKFDNNLFDKKSAMNEACCSGDTELVKWMCEKFDNNLFDLKTGMNNASRRWNTKLVKWLCEKFGNYIFDMKSSMNDACRSGDKEMVKWLLETFDNDLFDMKSAMNNACSSRYNTELVKWLCVKFDNDLFDIKSAMNEACSSGDTKLVKWMCEKFDNSLFDFKTGMNNAISGWNTKLVKWLCEKFDNNVFDMKSAMNEACSSGNNELVKWLLEKFDNDLFDMKS